MLAKRNLTIAVVILSLGLVGLVVAQSAGVLQAKPTAVATVDLERVFNELKEKLQLQADLRDRAAQLDQEREEKRQALANLQSDLDLLAPGSPAFEQKGEGLQKGVLEFRVWSEFENQRMQQERGLQLENLYRKTLETIGRMANEAGYDLVLFRETEPNFRYESVEQLSTLIQVRKVLWSADEIDLTDEIIQRMNNEFENVR